MRIPMPTTARPLGTMTRHRRDNQRCKVSREHTNLHVVCLCIPRPLQHNHHTRVLVFITERLLTPEASVRKG